MNDRDKKRAAARLGFNVPSASDLVKREDFKTEREYLAALADTAFKLNDPVVKTTLRKAGIERDERDEKEERFRQREEYEKIKKSIKIDSCDLDRAEREARQRANNDLAAGKISYGQLGATIATYTDAIVEKCKDQKASSAQINAMFRRDAGREME